jgi:hypothetical protein
MFFRRNRNQPDYKGISAKDMPERFEPKTIYVVGDKGHKWVAAFICPCGCGQLIQLNLLKDGDVSWRTSIHKDSSITIRPSIWRITGCRSHFTITRGDLRWVNDWD